MARQVQEYRLVLVLGDRFTGYSPGAMKEDAGLVSHARAWKRTAVVSDLGWVAHLSTAFGWMVPGKFKHFALPSEMQRSRGSPRTSERPVGRLATEARHVAARRRRHIHITGVV